MAIKREMIYGLQKGHKVSKITPRSKPSKSKGKISKKTRFVRELVREITGLAPYERRAIELLRISKDKKALKFLKRRIGQHKRGKAKRDEMQNVLQQQKRAAHK